MAMSKVYSMRLTSEDEAGILKVSGERGIEPVDAIREAVHAYVLLGGKISTGENPPRPPLKESAAPKPKKKWGPKPKGKDRECGLCKKFCVGEGCTCSCHWP